MVAQDLETSMLILIYVLHNMGLTWKIPILSYPEVQRSCILSTTMHVISDQVQN